MLRAGVLHATFESWGGAEWFIHQSAAGMPIATHRWSDPPGGGARPTGLLEHRCGAARSGPADWDRAGRLIAPWCEPLDVLVAHNWPALQWAEAAARAGAGKPVVWYCHEPPAGLYG